MVGKNVKFGHFASQPSKSACDKIAAGGGDCRHMGSIGIEEGCSFVVYCESLELSGPAAIRAWEKSLRLVAPSTHRLHSVYTPSTQVV